MFKGSLVALITPFRDGAVDETAFQEHRRLADRPGHARPRADRHDRRMPALSHDEQKRLIELCVEVAKGRAPVIAGTGSNSTAHTID